ncbi:hypothetical protein O3M35_000078 [Rhynocoris fuscipes]|uniref:Uncharacterized protein n=1 Tax=Rhynocoris fuscipes TaxID=488301 RepID=A0AAW1DLD4_9HEMI
MGQNLAIKMTTFDMHGVDKSFEKYAKYLIEQWFDEVRHYHYGTHYISGTGHYTQVM